MSRFHSHNTLVHVREDGYICGKPKSVAKYALQTFRDLLLINIDATDDEHSVASLDNLRSLMQSDGLDILTRAIQYSCSNKGTTKGEAKDKGASNSSSAVTGSNTHAKGGMNPKAGESESKMILPDCVNPSKNALAFLGIGGSFAEANGKADCTNIFPRGKILNDNRVNIGTRNDRFTYSGLNIVSTTDKKEGFIGSLPMPLKIPVGSQTIQFGNKIANSHGGMHTNGLMKTAKPGNGGAIIENATQSTVCSSGKSGFSSFRSSSASGMMRNGNGGLLGNQAKPDISVDKRTKYQDLVGGRSNSSSSSSKKDIRSKNNVTLNNNPKHSLQNKKAATDVGISSEKKYDINNGFDFLAPRPLYIPRKSLQDPTGKRSHDDGNCKSKEGGKHAKIKLDSQKRDPRSKSQPSEKGSLEAATTPQNPWADFLRSLPVCFASNANGRKARKEDGTRKPFFQDNASCASAVSVVTGASGNTVTSFSSIGTTNFSGSSACGAASIASSGTSRVTPNWPRTSNSSPRLSLVCGKRGNGNNPFGEDQSEQYCANINEIKRMDMICEQDLEQEECKTPDTIVIERSTNEEVIGKSDSSVKIEPCLELESCRKADIKTDSRNKSEIDVHPYEKCEFKTESDMECELHVESAEQRKHDKTSKKSGLVIKPMGSNSCEVFKIFTKSVGDEESMVNDQSSEDEDENDDDNEDSSENLSSDGDKDIIVIEDDASRVGDQRKTNTLKNTANFQSAATFATTCDKPEPNKISTWNTSSKDTVTTIIGSGNQSLDASLIVNVGQSISSPDFMTDNKAVANSGGAIPTQNGDPNSGGTINGVHSFSPAQPTPDARLNALIRSIPGTKEEESVGTAGVMACRAPAPPPPIRAPKISIPQLGAGLQRKEAPNIQLLKPDTSNLGQVAKPATRHANFVSIEQYSALVSFRVASIRGMSLACQIHNWTSLDRVRFFTCLMAGMLQLERVEQADLVERMCRSFLYWRQGKHPELAGHKFWQTFLENLASLPDEKLGKMGRALAKNLAISGITPLTMAKIVFSMTDEQRKTIKEFLIEIEVLEEARLHKLFRSIGLIVDTFKRAKEGLFDLGKLFTSEGRRNPEAPIEEITKVNETLKPVIDAGVDKFIVEYGHASFEKCHPEDPLVKSTSIKDICASIDSLNISKDGKRLLKFASGMDDRKCAKKEEINVAKAYTDSECFMKSSSWKKFKSSRKNDMKKKTENETSLYGNFATLGDSDLHNPACVAAKQIGNHPERSGPHQTGCLLDDDDEKEAHHCVKDTRRREKVGHGCHHHKSWKMPHIPRLDMERVVKSRSQSPKDFWSVSGLFSWAFGTASEKKPVYEVAPERKQVIRHDRHVSKGVPSERVPSKQLPAKHNAVAKDSNYGTQSTAGKHSKVCKQSNGGKHSSWAKSVEFREVKILDHSHEGSGIWDWFPFGKDKTFKKDGLDFL